MSATRAQIRQSIASSAALTASIEARGEALTGGFAGATLQKPGTEPKWNLVLPKGKWHGANFKRLGGSIDVTDEMVQEIVANWEAAGKPRLPIRWGHEHLSNTDPAKQALLDRKAGNLVELRAGAHGVEALTAWNELGAKDVETGAFDAWSPEWYPSHTSRQSGETKGWWLSGVALTGDPYFHTMPPVAASTQTTEPTPQHRSNTMNEEQLKALRANLGLSATATVDEILKASRPIVASVESNTEAITAAVAPVKAQLEVLTAANAKKDEQLTALTASLLERDVDAQVATAKLGDGKSGRTITEKQVLRAKQIAKSEGLTASAEFLNELPMLVPIAATGVQGTGAEPLTASAASAKLALEVEKLTKEGNISPYLTAIARNPELARIAQEGK